MLNVMNDLRDENRVDNFSHLGGLLSGIILSLVLIPIKEKSPSLKKRIGIYLIKFFSLCVYGILLGTLLYRFNIT